MHKKYIKQTRVMSSKIKLNRVLTPKTKKGQRAEDKPGEKALAGLIEKSIKEYPI